MLFIDQKVTEKYLTIVADQVEAFFHPSENNLSSNYAKAEDGYRDKSDTSELRRYIAEKDQLLEEQFNLIKILVTKLFNIDRGLKYLEERTSSVAKMSRDSCLSKDDIKQFQASLNSIKRKLTISLQQSLL
ncbi:uncharacterized protein LOC143202916 [Rhynchophorus ferrugineus]|uniref:uncharacterized protein LOC143202916 n=1 Tax=Rhynchophorus ferrugineus TaxID=354439 RepID=UPI003FCE8542